MADDLIQVWPGLEVVLVCEYVDRDAPRPRSNTIHIGPRPALKITVSAGSRGVVQDWPPGGYPAHLRYTPMIVDRALVKLDASYGHQLWIPIKMLDYANPLEKIARL